MTAPPPTPNKPARTPVNKPAAMTASPNHRSSLEATPSIFSPIHLGSRPIAEGYRDAEKHDELSPPVPLLIPAPQTLGQVARIAKGSKATYRLTSAMGLPSLPTWDRPGWSHLRPQNKQAPTSIRF